MEEKDQKSKKSEQQISSKEKSQLNKSLSEQRELELFLKLHIANHRPG